MKHYIVVIEEQGEKEHSFSILTTVADGADIDTILNDICRDWYDEPDEDEEGNDIPKAANEDGVYEFSGGIVVSVRRYTEIPPEHYAILAQYIPEL